mgnify:CR=1 FL=1
MATSFDTIEDMAIVLINDYKLAKLYEQDVTKFQTYCDGILLAVAPRFSECRQALTYNLETRTFDSDLTDLEIVILSLLWRIGWWERENNNSAEIALKLKVPSSFQYNSEANNFKEKRNVIDKLYEDLNRQITNYLLLDLSSYVY